MEDGPTPPLDFVNKKGLAKLELKVRVIQTLIKPLLLILHETGFLPPLFPLCALIIVIQVNQGSKQSEGLFFPPLIGCWESLDQRVFL